MDFLIIPWDVKPEIFSATVFGHVFAIRWYGLLFASGFVFGYYIIRKMFRNEGLPDELLDKLTVYTAIGTILGARLGHCFFYEPQYYLGHPLEIIKIWKGGLASHGAAIGILLALWLFGRNEKRTFLWTIDRVVIVVALAGCLIRLGNLFNSEIYGVETTLPWGFVFLQAGERVPKHPTQIYEALAYLITFFVLLRIYWKTKGKFTPGLTFGLFLIMVFTFRFFVEFVKEEQVSFEKGMSLNMGQLLSIPFVMAGIILLISAYRKKKSAPLATGKK
ncbi:MAG TPA: prolipoprotein diacylglyceryl transferase [Bacteroidales bacterium]|nr:prolipoprotein diacylglyceryl transferase [Bacteroidales bacterium]HPT11509.1 prolipoprotein diacylglyceryl transferase [Bacteroidales bacterium]